MEGTAIRIGFGLMVAAIVAAILQQHSVIDMLLLFAAAGVVPGTAISLSPNTTLLVVTLASVIIVALLFRRQLISVMRNLASMIRLPKTTAAFYLGHYLLAALGNVSSKIHAMSQRRTAR